MDDQSELLKETNADVIFRFSPSRKEKQTGHIHSVWASSPALHADTPTALPHADSARNQQFGSECILASVRGCKFDPTAFKEQRRARDLKDADPGATFLWIRNVTGRILFLKRRSIRAHDHSLHMLHRRITSLTCRHGRGGAERSRRRRRRGRRRGGG